jgi:TPP-dependent indolepyruvate ferredoxin oxidoreductase alpha subunit
MMAKAIVAEIMARQAVSFVLGAATALTLVLLVQYRAPAEGLSYAWTHGQISGRRSSDEQYHRRNDTAYTGHHAPLVAVAGDDYHLHQADTTLKVNSSFATATTHAAVVPSDLLSIKQRAPRRG